MCLPAGLYPTVTTLPRIRTHLDPAMALKSSPSSVHLKLKKRVMLLTFKQILKLKWVEEPWMAKSVRVIQAPKRICGSTKPLTQRLYPPQGQLTTQNSCQA